MFYNNKIKLLQENSALQNQLFNSQSTELSTSSEVGNIIQEWEVIFKKYPTIGLPEVAELIDSTISKRQGDQRKHSFLEKKFTPSKGKWIHCEQPRNDGWCYKAINSSISQNIFSSQNV